MSFIVNSGAIYAYSNSTSLDYDASGADKPPPSPPDENDKREECPEGTGCGKRTNILHRKKFKHILPTMEAEKRPKGWLMVKKINVYNSVLTHSFFSRL